MNRLCPICRTPFVKKNGLYYCESCSMYAEPMISSPSYSDDYVLHYKLYAKTVLSQRICEARWRFVESQISLEDKILLDFGCGADTFVEYRKRQKITFPKMFSYDPYFKVDHSFIDHKIDVLTLWDSLEHMPRLDMVLSLNADHVFLVVPIVDDVKDITVWKHYVPHEHLWYFSTFALNKMFNLWKYKMLVRANIEGHLRSPDIVSFYFVRKTP